MKKLSVRCGFIKGMIAVGAPPVVAPAGVFGETAPSVKVQVAIIGCGRIGTTMDALDEIRKRG